MAQSLVIKPGGRCSLPNRVIFVDVEPVVSAPSGTAGTHVHSFGSAYMTCCDLMDGKLASKAVLHCVLPWMFWSLLDEYRDTSKATWVFGHNIGYDLRLLGFWDWLPRSGATLVNCVLEDPPTIITVRLGRRIIKFVDVMNYWRLSVRDLSRACSRADSQATQRSGLQSNNTECCQHDVEVIESCMLRLIGLLAETGCCSLRTTAASLSWGAYLKCFLPIPLTISLDKRARSLERAAYFGGRVSAFALGSIKDTVTALDNNSLYPSVMASDLYPCRLVSHPYGLRPGELKAILRDYDGVASVDLWPGEYPYPTRTGGGVDFVRGITSATLAGNELRLSLDRCDVRKVHDAYIYERADLFSGFVTHFFRAKTAASAAGNRADVMLYKLFLNSLHGKFGQKGRQWTPAADIPARGYYDYWWHKRRGRAAPVRCRSVGGNVEAKEPGEDPRHCFPAISACITANARCVLENDLQTCGYHNVLYCDTDSIHTRDPGYERLNRVGRISQSKLGHYRSLIQADSAYYYGRQHYRIGDHLVCSSLKPTAVEVSDGVYMQDAMMGVERGLQTGILDSVPVAQRTIDMSRRSSDARRQAFQ